MGNSLTTAEVERYVLGSQKYSRATPPTETVVTFKTIDGRQLAITLRDKVPRIWLEDGNWLTKEIESHFEEVHHYPSGRGKHRNIERNAPRLARIHNVAKVVVTSLEMLARLLDAYEGGIVSDPSTEPPRTGGPPKAVADTTMKVLEGVLTEIKCWARKRNRGIRDSKLAGSNGICECCDVNFSKILQGAGTRALQVHHRKQLGLSDMPQLTSIADLAVVCANCHAMIHSNPTSALSVDELRDRWHTERQFANSSHNTDSTSEVAVSEA